MKRQFLVLTLVLALVFSMAACGSGSGGGAASDPNAGTYVCTSVEMMGITMTAAEVFESEEVIITLEGGGKGSLEVNGSKGNATWTLDGTDFVLTIEEDGEKAENVGTLENGVITIDLLGTGCNCTFEKQK